MGKVVACHRQVGYDDTVAIGSRKGRHRNNACGYCRS